MLSLRGCAHIRTMWHAKSFRSCLTAAGAAMIRLDQGRISSEEAKRDWRGEYRLWLAGQTRGRSAKNRRLQDES